MDAGDNKVTNAATVPVATASAISKPEYKQEDDAGQSQTSPTMRSMHAQQMADLSPTVEQMRRIHIHQTQGKTISHPYL